MAITNVNRLRADRRQFQDLFQYIIEYEADWNPDNVLSNGEVHEAVTVTGARPGDLCFSTIDVDVQDLDLSCHVTANDTVTVGLHNSTGGAVDIGSCNLHIIVLQLRHVH